MHRLDNRTPAIVAVLLGSFAFEVTSACRPKSETPKAEAAATTTPPLQTAGTLAAAEAPSTPSGMASDTVPKKAYNGWKQYESLCARCHGEFGVGSTFAPSLVTSLRGSGPVPDEATFAKIVREGRAEKGMPAFPQLGDVASDMYAYLKLRADGKVKATRPSPAAT